MKQAGTLAILVVIPLALARCNKASSNEAQENACRLAEAAGVEKVGQCLMNRYHWQPQDAALAQLRYQTAIDSAVLAEQRARDDSVRRADSIHNQLARAQGERAKRQICPLLNSRLNLEEQAASVSVSVKMSKQTRSDSVAKLNRRVQEIQSRIDSLLPYVDWRRDELASHCGF
jgi:hypothetical protein